MSATLHADLQSFLHAGILDHPLVIVDNFGERFISFANRKYMDKRGELDRAAQAGDWTKYIWLHERPYRVEALARIADRMSGEQFWRAIREVWMDAEDRQHRLWIKLWGSARPYREHVMTDAERERLRRLREIEPGYVAIYRSANHHPITNGLAWTVSRSLAERKKELYLGEAMVRKDRIRAFFAEGREVLVLPRHCEHLSIRTNTKASH